MGHRQGPLRSNSYLPRLSAFVARRLPSSSVPPVSCGPVQAYASHRVTGVSGRYLKSAWGPFKDVAMVWES